MRRAFITGAAGFIGYHLSQALLDAGWQVTGYDALTDYYDVTLKTRRLELLARHAGFAFVEARLEDAPRLHAAMQAAAPQVVVHLAAQAGVRYSIDNPRAFVDANITGSFNLLEAAQSLKVGHVLMASTSSAYGANRELPFDEGQKTATPMSIYAATKLATEALAHAHAHIHAQPITMFRFFTVYGPWGRPDMALFKFATGIARGRPIDIYNHGQMWRDFTYVDDLIHCIRALIDLPPGGPESAVEGDSLSPVAPFRLVNIGNSQKILLEDFITAIEGELGRKAIRNDLPIQPGDLPATWADTGLLQRLTGTRPHTPLAEGVARYMRWFRGYYGL